MRVILIKISKKRKSLHGGEYIRCFFKSESNESLRLDVYMRHTGSVRWLPYLTLNAVFDNVSIFKDNIINGNSNFNFIHIKNQNNETNKRIPTN